jgi:hypothetical protein
MIGICLNRSAIYSHRCVLSSPQVCVYHHLQFNMVVFMKNNKLISFFYFYFKAENENKTSYENHHTHTHTLSLCVSRDEVQIECTIVLIVSY